VTTPHNHVLIDYENVQPEVASRLVLASYFEGQSLQDSNQRIDSQRLECVGLPHLVHPEAQRTMWTPMPFFVFGYLEGSA
jgi:hypothetical protein